MRLRPCQGCWGTGRDPVSTRRLPCAFCKGRGFDPQPTLVHTEEPSANLDAAILETLKEAGLD